MEKWESNMTTVTINNNVDPIGWFRVMIHTSDARKHQVNQGDNYNNTPLTVAKGNNGYITILSEFYFNGDILDKEYDHKFTEQGGNEKPWKMVWLSP